MKFNSKIGFNSKRLNLAILTAVSLMSCSSASIQLAKPAVLTDSSETVMQQLRTIISAELGYQQVNLSNKVLVDSSWLVIARQTRRTINHPKLLGRDLQQVVRFQLKKSAEKCYLVLSSMSKSWQLENARCEYK